MSYDEDIGEVRHYLARVQPVGWLEEYSKLENMGTDENSPHLIGAESWQVKMRMLNRDLVLPRQVNQTKRLQCLDILPRACSSLTTGL